MTAWSADGVSLLAHGVHYALVVGGLLGVSWLLVPQLVDRHAGPHSPRAPRDAHEARVAELRAAAAAGTLTLIRPATMAPTTASTTASVQVPARPAPAYAAAATLLLPVAVVASAAAAGVHAAMGPRHFEEATLFGLFFAGSSLGQLAWTALVLQRLDRALLVAGLVGNLACVLLWAQTRTLGLPFGLLPLPEAVGPWDLAAVAWELVVVGACAALLAAGPASYAALRVAPWAAWHRVSRSFLVVSALALTALSFSGAAG